MVRNKEEAAFFCKVSFAHTPLNLGISLKLFLTLENLSYLFFLHIWIGIFLFFYF